MSTAPTLAGMAQPERVGFLRQLAIDTGYTLLGFPLATASFSHCGRAVGRARRAGRRRRRADPRRNIVRRPLLRRRRAAALSRRAAPTTDPADPQGGATGCRRLEADPHPLTQTQSWLDLAHGILHFPIAVATFSIVVSWWAAAIGGTLTIAWDWSIPRGPDNRSLAQLMGLGDSTFARVGLQTAIGIVCLISLPVVVRGCALISAGFSRFVLTSVAEMRRTITVLTEQKAAAASAEATALRRLERDIHDGPQQRLVRLAMDLSRARQHVDGDPDALRNTLDEAIGQTQETLDELRALSRGIAPQVLTDRGLPSALAALAVRCTVPVELSVDDELGTPTGRLDAAVETTAYFAVAEALTNVAKHSGAENCRVTVAHGPGRVGVEVVDDGDGGAHLAKGHGLSGLADRVRSTGGTLTVVSPAGGPTTVRVDLPC